MYSNTELSSTYAYSKQFEMLLKQVIRVFAGFQYLTGTNADGMGQLVPVPCKYGDGSRMVAQILNNNSENTAISVPMFSVWIKDVQLSNDRRNCPVYENMLGATERSINYNDGRYTSDPGCSYEINRLMPIPLDIQIQVDLITSNTSQHWQLLEQVLLLFNPSISIQTNQNNFDWTNPINMELTNINYNSKTIPVGSGETWNVAGFTFKIPFYLSPPVKVKRLVPIRTIITDIGRDSGDDIQTWTSGDFTQFVVSAEDHKININGNYATLLGKNGSVVDENGDVYDWKDVIDSIGFYDPSTTLIRLRPGINISYLESDVLAYVQYDVIEKNKIILNYIQDTLPTPTLTNINAIIDPKVSFPNNNLPVPTIGDRYLIIKAIIPNTVSWGNFQAERNSIIQWSGTQWTVSFDPSTSLDGAIVKNNTNGKLYCFISDEWVTAVEGIYTQGFWGLQFFSDKSEQEQQ